MSTPTIQPGQRVSFFIAGGRAVKRGPFIGTLLRTYENKGTWFEVAIDGAVEGDLYRIRPANVAATSF